MLTKVLISGATAFVGSHLADYLLDEVKVEVHGIKRPRSRDEFVRKEVIYHEADVTDYTGVSQLVKAIQPDYLFSLAAQSFVPLSWQAPWATFEVNVNGTLNVLEAVRRESPHTVILVPGSSEEYGKVLDGEIPVKETNPLRPQSPYGVSKVAADLYCQQYHASYGVKVVITRAHNHEGPRRGEQFFTSTMAKQIAEIEAGLKEPIVYVGNLDAKRDITDVRDMVRAYWLAITKCEYGTPYNICQEKCWSMREILDMYLEMSDVKVDIRIDKDRLRPSDVPLLLGDCSKFKRQTNWQPTIPIEQTLSDLLWYWRERV